MSALSPCVNAVDCVDSDQSAIDLVTLAIQRDLREIATHLGSLDEARRLLLWQRLRELLREVDGSDPSTPKHRTPNVGNTSRVEQDPTMPGETWLTSAVLFKRLKVNECHRKAFDSYLYRVCQNDSKARKGGLRTPGLPRHVFDVAKLWPGLMTRRKKWAAVPV